MECPKGVTGIPPPVERPGRWYKVLWPKLGRPLPLVFLDECITGVWMHYGGYTLPCDGTPHCRGCKEGFDLKWAGFAAAWAASPKGLCIASVTLGAVKPLLAEVCKHGTLRGTSVMLKRTGDKPNGPVRVVLNARVAEEHLLPAFDIMPSLRKLWGISERYLFRGKPDQARREDCDPDEMHVMLPRRQLHHPNDDFSEVPL